MKKHTLSVVGNVEINSFGDLKVNSVQVLEKFLEAFGLDKENFETKQFAGKVEITILDFTEPLVIDVHTDREEC